MKLLARFKSWFLSIRWWIWAAICFAGILLLVVLKLWSRFMDEKTVKELDKDIKEIGNKMAEVQSKAIEQKAIVKAKTEEKVKEIQKVASEPDPVQRRQKLAEYLNSL